MSMTMMMLPGLLRRLNLLRLQELLNPETPEIGQAIDSLLDRGIACCTLTESNGLETSTKVYDRLRVEINEVERHRRTSNNNHISIIKSVAITQTE